MKELLNAVTSDVKLQWEEVSTDYSQISNAIGSNGFVYNGEIYFYGALYAPYTNLYKYNPSNNEFILINSLSQFVGNECSTIIGDNVYFFRSKNIYKLNLIDFTFTTEASHSIALTSGTFTHIDASVESFNDKIYIFGGASDVGSGTKRRVATFNSLIEYDIYEKTFTLLSTTGYARPSLFNVYSVEHDGVIYYFGGSSYSGSGSSVSTNYTNYLYKFNIIEKSFEFIPLTGAVISNRAQGAIGYFNNQLLIYGGYSNAGMSYDTYIVDLNTRVVSKIESENTPVGSYMTAYTQINKRLYLFGGWPGNNRLNYIDF